MEISEQLINEIRSASSVYKTMYEEQKKLREEAEAEKKEAEKEAEECKKEFVKTSLEERLPIEIIKKLAKVNEQFIYNVAKENNLQVNEG